MKKLTCMVLVTVMILGLAGCKHEDNQVVASGTEYAGVTYEQAEDAARKVCAIASARYTGLTDEVKYILDNNLTGEYGDVIRDKFLDGFKVWPVYLTNELHTMYQELYEASIISVGFDEELLLQATREYELNEKLNSQVKVEDTEQKDSENIENEEVGPVDASPAPAQRPDYVSEDMERTDESEEYQETREFAEPLATPMQSPLIKEERSDFIEEYPTYESWYMNYPGEMDYRTEYDEAGEPYIMSDKLNVLENGKASIKLMGEFRNVYIGTDGSLLDLCGDSGYDFVVADWSLFDDGQMLLYLQTRGGVTLTEDVDMAGQVGMTFNKSGDYRLAIKVSLSKAEDGTVKIEPSAESIPSLTQKIVVK